MIRKIIHIDQEKCNGCGICASACHEGAIGMEKGKAVLLREDYCDGLGDCLPACPTGAITFTTREAAAYDHAAVQRHLASREQTAAPFTNGVEHPVSEGADSSGSDDLKNADHLQSSLRQWPVQIKLIPTSAPYFQNADLLIAADCTAFAYGDFHRQFMDGKVTLIACPKLDAVDYSEKLTTIFTENSIRSVTIVRMEVPCCGGLTHAVQTALNQAEEQTGRRIPVSTVIVSTEGNLLS